MLRVGTRSALPWEEVTCSSYSVAVVAQCLGISPEMAVRLSKAFGGSPAVWLKMPMDYDLAQVEKNAGKIKVRRVLQPA